MEKTIIGAGSLAYVETVFAGMVPVKVLGQAQHHTAGFNTVDGVLVKATADRSGYRKGETFTVAESSVIPRTHVKTRRGRLYITGMLSPGWTFKFNG